MTIAIRQFTELDPGAIRRLITGYSATAQYQVHHSEAAEQTLFQLVLVPLAQPFVKRYDYLDDDAIQRYAAVVKLGYSWGAYRGEEQVGILLTEPHEWNGSLWVWEFHVAERVRGQGIGRQLMERAAVQAKAAGLRTIVCETQTTNVPAIQAYRQLGFRLEGVDLSYYSNEDYPDGEVAVFMKRRLKE